MISSPCHDEAESRRTGATSGRPHLNEAATEGLGSRHPYERPVREEVWFADFLLVVPFDEEAPADRVRVHPGHRLRVADELLFARIPSRSERAAIPLIGSMVLILAVE